jgi:putative ABC transport system substrate-binding protein
MLMFHSKTLGKATRQVCGSAALAIAFCIAAPAGARAADEIPHIGYLSIGSRVSNGAFLDAFREGLRGLGYVDGRDIVVDVRWSGDSVSDFPELAASLVETKPTLIVGTCIPSTRAAKEATRSIPIVMSVDGDPVTAGLVASLARPGANVTGTSTLFEELVPKWIELLTVAVPKARVIAALVDPDDLADPYFWAKLEEAAHRFGIKLVRAEARTPEDLERTFAEMARQRVDALVVMTNPLLAGQAARVVALANRYRLPGIYGYREFAELGGMMSYGLSFREYFRNVARYADKVLRGAKPAELPIERPTKIEFVINLAAARMLGVSIPHELLLRADAALE